MTTARQKGSTPAGTYGPPENKPLRFSTANEPARQAKPNSYLEAAVMTTGKEQLLMMLLDGAIRFTESGREAITDARLTDAHKFLVRSQEIVTELLSSLKREIGDEIYANLVRLYHFCYDRLVRANVEQSTEMADDAIQTLRGIKEMWAAAIERMNKEGRPTELNPSQILTHRLDGEG